MSNLFVFIADIDIPPAGPDPVARPCSVRILDASTNQWDIAALQYTAVWLQTHGNHPKRCTASRSRSRSCLHIHFRGWGIVLTILVLLLRLMDVDLIRGGFPDLFLIRSPDPNTALHLVPGCKSGFCRSFMTNSDITRLTPGSDVFLEWGWFR